MLFVKHNYYDISTIFTLYEKRGIKSITAYCEKWGGNLKLQSIEQLISGFDECRRSDGLVSQPFNQPVIFFEVAKGFHRELKQNPAEGKYCQCEPDFPGPCRFRTPPDKRQRQGSRTTNSDDNKGFSEIPRNLLLCGGLAPGRI